MPADSYSLRDLDKRPVRGAIDRSKTLDLLPPQFAKLSFLTKVHGRAERMWVKIMYVTRKGDKITYGGSLHNDPQLFHPGHLRFGEMVEFGPHHILDVYDGEALDSSDPAENVVECNPNFVQTQEETLRLLGVLAAVPGPN